MKIISLHEFWDDEHEKYQENTQLALVSKKNPLHWFWFIQKKSAILYTILETQGRVTEYLSISDTCLPQLNPMTLRLSLVYKS